MLTKKLVKQFAKSFAKAVELPDATVSYHKGGVVGLCNKGLDFYYHFIKTTHDLAVVVTDNLGDNSKLYGRVLIKIPVTTILAGDGKLETNDYQFKYVLRVLADAIVTDFFSPSPLDFGRCMLQPKGWSVCSSSSVMFVVANSIKKRVPVFDTFNIYLDGLLHYGIRDEPWHQSGTDLTMYCQDNYIVVTVRVIQEKFDTLHFGYKLCEHYDINSISELSKLVEDVVETHKTLNN